MKLQTRQDLLDGLKKLSDELGIEVCGNAAQDIETLVRRCRNLENVSFERILSAMVTGMVTKEGPEFNDVTAAQCVVLARLVCEEVQKDDDRRNAC